MIPALSIETVAATVERLLHQFNEAIPDRTFSRHSPSLHEVHSPTRASFMRHRTPSTVKSTVTIQFSLIPLYFLDVIVNCPVPFTTFTLFITRLSITLC
jgi:hypothetical protein